jgi:hypothetical protein
MPSLEVQRTDIYRTSFSSTGQAAMKGRASISFPISGKTRRAMHIFDSVRAFRRASH